MEEKMEEQESSEVNQLLVQLVIRQSALEKELIKAGIVTEKGLAESMVECMIQFEKFSHKKPEESENKEASQPDSELIKLG